MQNILCYSDLGSFSSKAVLSCSSGGLSTCWLVGLGSQLPVRNMFSECVELFESSLASTFPGGGLSRVLHTARRCLVGTANVRNEIVKFKTAATRIHAMFVYIVCYMMLYSADKNICEENTTS